MKKYNRLNRFPLGSIQARGFLKEQLMRGKDGMAGHLYELEPGILADPYIKESKVSVWEDVNQAGWGGELSANYWHGYIEHAFVLNDFEMIARATKWVDEMLKNQQEDGYLGTYCYEGANIYDDFNGWSTACAMRALLSFYDVTGREDVLEAVHRCMLWFVNTWTGDKKTTYAAAYIIEPLVFCYFLTQDQRLIDYAEEYAEFLCTKDIFPNSYRHFLEEEIEYTTLHTVAAGMHARLPALLYAATGKEIYLKASEKYIEKLRRKCVHVSGAPVSVAEFLGPVGMTTESEYCNFTHFNTTYSYLSYVTGKGLYGDYMEEIFYNAAQGARKKDERAIAYMTAPNQAYATKDSTTAGANPHDQVYAPCVPVACCPANAVALIPEFVRDMMFFDDDHNIYVSAYGPCHLQYEDINIEVKTLYPFRNRVVVEIHSEGSFGLCLKVPQWAEGYRVAVNGETVETIKDERGYVKVRQIWKSRDIVEITFAASPQVIHVDDSDASKKYPLAIKYGALLFAYHIPERWEAYPGTPVTPLPEGWSWFNVKPIYKSQEGGDEHDCSGTNRHRIPWNIALDEKLQPEQISIERLEENGYAWENPIIKLHTECYKAPYLYPPYPNKTLEPAKDKHRVTEKLPLELVPYGCTNLRITYFPRADV